METTKISCWKVFRLVFVFFHLYLMGDAFYRWDGFSYHSSLSEFLLSVALISVLWSFLAVLSSIGLWLLVKIVEQLFMILNGKIRAEHALLFSIFFVVSGALAWNVKILLGGVATLFIKLVVLLCIVLSAIYFTWLFRHKFAIIQERITPLVWIFGVFVVISIPIVSFTAFRGNADDVVLQKSIKRSGANLDRPNIILITFDALTTENMSLYGYNRLTTPFISSWAKGASVFTRAEAESCWTPPTVASLMLGKRVWTHQLYHSEGGAKPVKSDTENMPLVLQNHGYATMAFIVNQSHASPKILGISKNFHIEPLQSEFVSYINNTLDRIDVWLSRLFFGKIKMYDWFVHADFIFSRIVNQLSNYDKTVTVLPPQKAFNNFLKIIDNDPQKPFFAWFHLYPPHHPYLPPEPYMGMFDSSSRFRTDKSQNDLIMFSTSRISQFYPNEDVQPIVDTLRARYDEFIRFADNQFEVFINQLKQRDELDNTIIILSSDHGESFEHDFVGHGGPLYEEKTHIPLIIKDPFYPEGNTIDTLVEQIDIPATILELAQIQIPTWMEGRSLVPLMQGKSLPSRPAFSMNFPQNYSRGHQITKGTIAVWDGDYKLMHTLKNKKSLLFNLKKDPDELNDLFNDRPEVASRLLSLIKTNLAKANERIMAGE